MTGALVILLLCREREPLTAVLFLTRLYHLNRDVGSVANLERKLRVTQCKYHGTSESITGATTYGFTMQV